MTLYLVDCSRHQVERNNPLDLAKAKAAGFAIVNIQLDRGKQADILPAWALDYATAARSLGMGVSTYKWLDSRTSGAESARRAFDRMCMLGGPDEMAHIVDTEADASEQQVRDYVTVMQGLLGRPIAIYSADWWLVPRGWQLAGLTPFLHAAPNDGYPGMYPGDTSSAWRAGYAGWPNLSLMQYAVKAIPGTGDCSLSAIRDPAVWEALTGGRSMRSKNMQVLTNQIKAKWPGVVVYGVGDAEHKLSPSGHNEDDTPGSKPEDEDADNIAEHRALDIMLGPKFTRADGNALIAALIGNADNRRRLLYVIFDGYIWRRNGGWVREVKTGDLHRDHPHVSGEADDDENTTPWVLGASAAEQPKDDEDMQPVLIKLAGDPTVRLVTMGVGHIPVTDEADLKRWQNWMRDNGMGNTVWNWSADMRQQCGPDLTAVATLEITPEVAEVIARQIVAAGSNDLSDADLSTIADLVVTGAKRAAREGTA